jgi:hypothetical protein
VDGYSRLYEFLQDSGVSQPGGATAAERDTDPQVRSLFDHADSSVQALIREALRAPVNGT